VILRLLGALPGDQFRVSFCETMIASDDHPKSQIGRLMISELRSPPVASTA
jgi:hypothetical protein